MSFKLLALAAVVALFVALSQTGGGSSGSLNTDSRTVTVAELVPATLGGYAATRSWDHKVPGMGVEQGAVYGSAAGEDPVQLDFFRNNPNAHNGIACFLFQGESMVWEKLQPVQTANGSALFDVALMRSGDQLRLVAATECSAQGCTEQRLTFWEQFSQVGLRNLFAPQPVVPVSVVLKHSETGDGAADTEKKLLDEFQRAASMIDLAPARQLAADR